MRQPDSVQVGLNLRVLTISGTWTPNASERDAAWELYVELVTRIGVVPLGHGINREALNSLYSIFGSTREILRKYGPVLAEPKSGQALNFGYLAIGLLNNILRPFLAYWHPLLSAWEDRRPSDTPALDHELGWSENDSFRSNLNSLGEDMRGFVGVLAEACGVPQANFPSSG